jgi:hybrid cluster-associated redox disulfide protein
MWPRMFTAETVVADALRTHPKARWVFAAYHLGGCTGCSRSDAETLSEVAEGYRIPLEDFLRDLNSLSS